MAFTRKNEDGIYVVQDSISCDRYMFESDAESVKAYIDDIVEEATQKGMVGNGRFDISVSNGWYDSYELEINYEFERVENDKERTAREKIENDAKAAAAEKRRAAAAKRKLKSDPEFIEYERLRAKFGT
jgi:hypothetical protein